MAQIQSVDLCYIERNAGIAIFTLCFLEHTPSSSSRCHLTADKQSSCGGSSWPRWAFRTTLEASLTARKIHLILRSASERQDLLADPSKQCFEEPRPHRYRLSNYQPSTSHSYFSEINPSRIFRPLHHCPPHTTFSSILLLLI